MGIRPVSGDFLGLVRVSRPSFRVPCHETRRVLYGFTRILQGFFERVQQLELGTHTWGCKVFRCRGLGFGAVGLSVLTLRRRLGVRASAPHVSIIGEVIRSQSCRLFRGLRVQEQPTVEAI